MDGTVLTVAWEDGGATPPPTRLGDEISVADYIEPIADDSEPLHASAEHNAIFQFLADLKERQFLWLDGELGVLLVQLSSSLISKPPKPRISILLR